MQTLLKKAANPLQGLTEGQVRSRVHVDDQGPEFPKETSVELRCLDAFGAVSHFERTHCLALQNMGFSYLQRRSELVSNIMRMAEAFGLRQEVAHDAILLMDRTMSTSIQVGASPSCAVALSPYEIPQPK